jgi:hypothetical protein
MKIISFFANKEQGEYGQPAPMKSFVPEWYKDSESTFLDKDSGEMIAGLKKCVPVLDGLVSGYAITLPHDVYVSRSESGELKLSWNLPDGVEDFIAERPVELGAKMPRPAGHYPNHMVWKGVWGVKTPKNWSLLVVHPLNRFDLPFTTYSAIMDSDKFSAPGNIPFFIKENFEGLIPAGTPVAQLIPIKRERWVMNKNNKGLLNLLHEQGEIVRQPETTYKKKMWVRKEYS